MACILAVGALAFASAAHGQVIEEGGFPVKGGDVSGESFSLSCPPRLVVEAGESVALSCSATDVPEEGVRYGWESVSGEGFYLLSASDELSPLFTASLSGAGEEYAYRLTAMAAGVYRMATVTVTVGGVPGETVGAPVVREECDSFTIPGELGEGCVEDKGPAPFGFGSEGEGGFLFPEAPGLPDRPSGPVRGGGSVMQAPPRLECPVAIFLEELETGSIECRVFDASGEEHLEYSWEPVGSTTRDYLENPRLIPEDSPTPSVVAPEAPAYETLESFRSVETTFRYRYRLTATSRATGLSSRTEVEVFVSGSRPGVYCPLEVAVEEGETVALDCEGVDPLSGRMDYDEDGASIAWEWEGLWGASTALLDATDRSSPLFTAPPGSAGEAYHYIASMTSQASGASRTARRRVTVTVVGGEGGQASSDASALSRKGGAPVVTCEDSKIYEATADFTLACTVTDEPAGATYAWTGTDIANRLSSTTILKPTFIVPHNIKEPWLRNKDYVYTVTLSASDIADVTEDVKVTVLEKPDIRCDQYTPLTGLSVKEGRRAYTLRYCISWRLLHSDYRWEYYVDARLRFKWTPRGSTPDTNLLSATDTAVTTFLVPDDVSGDTTFEYLFTASAENVDPRIVYVDITVRDTDPPVLSITCVDTEAYEGSADITLDCSASGAPGDNPQYAYVWTPRGDTQDTALLSAVDVASPTFLVPDEVASTTTYEYLLTSSAANAESGSAEMTVTVLNREALRVVCADPGSAYEGSADFDLDCSASGAPAGSEYAYVWTPWGDTQNTALLSAVDVASPTFLVPDEVASRTTYEYLLTVSAANAESSSARVAVTVLNKKALRVACADPPSAYEGSADITLDCSASGAPEGSDYAYAWTPRGSASDTALLSATDIASPLFYVPSSVTSNETYEYLLTVSAENAEDASVDVSVRVLNKVSLALVCADTSPEVYEGSDDIELDCEASGAPSGSSYSYAWRARGATAGTSLLSRTDNSSPVFYVPDEVDEDETHQYALTASARNAESATAFVTMTVLKRGSLSVACTDPGAVYEGSTDVAFDCSASGAPEGSDYEYVWTARGGTANTLQLSAPDISSPTFHVPDAVDVTTDYEYLLTVSAANAEDASVDVSVRVLNKVSLALVCADTSPEVYEGSDDIELDCEASGAPSGSSYSYAWRARGATAGTSLLSRTDNSSPVFYVPDEVDEDETHQYALTASARNAESATAFVTMTVLKRGSLSVACTDPGAVYEGSTDVAFDCSASGAPEGSDYEYVWTARGGTANTLQLSAPDISSPTFHVPDAVDVTTDYEYLLTVSAANAEDASVDVSVRVLNKVSLALVCADTSPEVYEGSENITLDCSATGAPGDDPVYTYAWTARGGTADTDLLSATDGSTPTFLVPDEVDNDEIYEYRLTVSAGNAGFATAEVTVTVLNRGALALACADPGAVYEGSADVAFDCTASGAPGGSSYEYAWTARGGTADTDLLGGTDGPAPTFAVPDEVSENETYEYLLTVSAANAEDASAEVTVTVLDKEALSVVCTDPAVYEGSADITLDCSATGAPEDSGYDYVWTPRGMTANTDNLIGGTDGPAPTFHVPDAVDVTTDYEYLLTVSAANAEDASAEVTVTVLDKEALSVVCTDPAVYEGSADITLDCSASGAPGDDPVYTYAWTARGGTADMSLLSATDGPAPTFLVPDEVDSDETYEYLLTVSAANAEDAAAEVAVTVLDKEALTVVCTDPAVYEGSADFSFDCTASGAPGDDPVYTYAWTARGGTADTDLLSAADIASPTFAVPDKVEEDETYEYLLTVSAANAEDAAAEVAVTVLDKEALALACADPGSVYEGSEDFSFDCTASGAPGGSDYEYAWMARGGTADTDLLSATDGSTPTFLVPDEVDNDEIYEYLLTVSAENAEDAAAEVAVTVLDKEALTVVCTDPAVYEGSADITLDCTASGAPGDDPVYTYAWTARGGTADTDLLGGTDGPAPTFDVPDAVDVTTDYEYLLTVSADNAESATAEVTVTVLNKEALALACADPGSVYEGSSDIAFDCTASGAPEGSDYEYAWMARGGTADTDLLSGADGPDPTFYVPDEVSEDETYEYLLTVSADNAESATAEVTVTVLNREALSVVCTNGYEAFEGSGDITLDCSASGAPSGSDYAYAWTARGGTGDTSLLSATDIASPTFYVPAEVAEDETYEYLLTVSADNAESATAEVTVTVLNREALSVVCADSGSVYEGSEDFSFDCTASGDPEGSDYEYAWTARGGTANTDLLIAGTNGPTPTFYVPDAVDVTTTYEYLLTVSAANAEDASAEVTVTVLNREALSVVCTNGYEAFEGSGNITLDCSASGAPSGSDYAYAWTARGGTGDTSLLSATDIASPTFYVPAEVAEDETYEYLLTVSAVNAEDASATVTVTVLNREALSVVCTNGYEAFEGSGNITLDCSASGAPSGSDYAYAWTARGGTGDTSLLSATDIASPTFYVPAEVAEDETYEYLLTVSAANAEDASAEVTVTVLDRVLPPVADATAPEAASPLSPEAAEPSSLGVTASASPLRFGVQSADTEASLDPMTDGMSTRVSGPYHAGRMTLSLDGSEAIDENGEMDLSIELASPVVLRRKGGVEASSIVLAPLWSLSESCEQLSSQAIGSLYTETTLADGNCRLLRFGGELDLTGVPSGHYAGTMDVILRSGENEETHSVEVDVTVIPAQRVITIGPGGVRFNTSREVPVALTEEQNLSIYPDVAFMTEEQPHGAFELSNPSLIPLEVTVSARFGYTEATAAGREVVVEDTSGSHLGDLSSLVDIHPGVLVLMPGEKGLVRYGVKEGALAAMPEKGYAAFFDVVSEPRQYVRTDRMPEEVEGDRTARVTMRVPGMYVPGEGASQLRATLLSVSFVGSPSATFLVETEDRPFAGEVVAYDGEGRELGRRETLVYTRSRVRIPLDRIPEEDTVFLRFAPRGSGRVPAPASVEWGAPRRDIGAAAKDRTATPETLARKP